MKILLIFLFGSQVLGQVFERTVFPPAVTSFSCHGRPPGYYADLETGCKTYHVCDGNSYFTYVCPDRTLFQQRSRICDHFFLVHCEKSHFYEKKTIYSGDEEDDLIRVLESEEIFLNKELFVDDYNHTEGFFPTETAKPLPDKFTEILISPRTPKTHTTTEKPGVEPATTKEVYTSRSSQKFLKFRLKDSRSLFFIPEFENNSIVTHSERELLLPLQKNDLMRFKYQERIGGSLSICPSHCNPKFFFPGFCHPCIVIK